MRDMLYSLKVLKFTNMRHRTHINKVGVWGWIPNEYAMMDRGKGNLENK